MSSSNDTDRAGIIINGSGISTPDASAIRERYVADWKGIYGEGLDTRAATPQGQIIDTETAVTFDKNERMAYLAGQFNVDTAEGVFQDALYNIYFVQRQKAVASKTYQTDLGLSGLTRLAHETQIIDRMGNIWALSEDATFPEGGVLTDVEYYCLTPGPVSANAGAIDRIYRGPASGWDSTTNPNPPVAGTLDESRMALNQRYKRSVAQNAHGNVDSVRGSVGNLDGVISVQAEDNVKGYELLINGVIIHGHSIFVSVYGGADEEIAQAIHERLDGGCGMDGNREVIIQTPTRYGTKPTRITFNRPEAVRAQVKVAIELYSLTLTTDISDAIKQRVVDAWNGNDGTSIRVQIGEEVFASRFYCPVRALTNDGVFFDIVNIKVRRIYGGGVYVYDNAFDYTGDYLVPKVIPDGETNPLVEMDADGYQVTKDGLAPQKPENSMLELGSDGYLVNRTDMYDQTGATWSEWADSFTSTLNEMPVLSVEDVIVEAMGI